MATKADSPTAVSTLPKPLPVRGDLDFDYVIAAEIEDINIRRSKLGRAEQTSDIGFSDQRKMLDVVGLALSGGGIRSASFCLGVLQALNHFDAIKKVDYMSTVSGGGYIGASLSATMTNTGGRFTYGGGSAALADQPPEEISDTASVSHIRNYSNYLIPFGLGDVLSALAIIIRGLVANLSQLLVVVLVLAGATVLLNPSRSRLVIPDPFGLPFNWLPSAQFGFTSLLALLLPALFLAWALYRSYLVLAPRRSLRLWARCRSFLDPAFDRPLRERGILEEWVRRRRLVGRIYLCRKNRGEFRGVIPQLAVFYLVILAFAAFMEAQPFVIDGMFAQADLDLVNTRLGRQPATGGLFLGLVSSWADWLALIAAPIVALVTVFRKSLGEIIGASAATTRLRTKIAGLLARSLVWVAGAALPLLIWVGYLYLSYWAIPNDVPVKVPAVTCARDGASGIFRLGDDAGAFSGTLALDRTVPCTDLTAAKVILPLFGQTPEWIVRMSPVVERSNPVMPDRPAPAPYLLYFILAGILFVLSRLLSSNANSLHRLYRDRLSKAFVFDPTKYGRGGGVAGGRDLAPCDAMKLTDIDPAVTPYHLINAALNVQGSDFSNRRGRNADFFLFSRRYVGSPATGYAPTAQMQKKAADLDLATALAISGAAASSNMGSKSVRALTPTLAILNVRLGYWLTNPFFAFHGEKGDVQEERPHRLWSYLGAEMFSRLTENKNVVYITDGGHIENLGVYELLRRRCKLIVAVDAEADPDMRFNSLVTLERYARIDLGVRIKIPLQQLAETGRAWMGVGGRDKPKAELDATRGPHVVIGTIDYGRDEVGYLVYVKASLSGDESDYIRDYARLHPRFPHETTGDQFFSEEQFEVYRALGFHAMYGFLAGSDDVVVKPSLVPAEESKPKPTENEMEPAENDVEPGTPAKPTRTIADGGRIVRANHPALAAIRGML